MNAHSDPEPWTSSQAVCPWQNADRIPKLTAGELHLWWVPLCGSEQELRKLRDMLSARERDRADRYRFARHRDGFTFGRGVLRLLLAAYTGQAADQIDFVLGSYGKPSMLPGSEFRQAHFNYSDAADHALFGFIRNAEIGIDLENLDREVSFERIVERKFSRKEAKALLSLPVAVRKSAFLACWTRKEGYGKAQGWGINYPLDSVELCLDCAGNRVDVEVSGSEHWVIRQIYPTRRFTGTVVYPAAAEAGRCFELKYMTISPGRMLQLCSEPPTQ